MNNLEKILREYNDLGLDAGFTAKNENGELIMLQLIDTRSPSWEVVFEIEADQVRVLEFNSDCYEPEQSNHVVKTFEEALKMAGEWC